MAGQGFPSRISPLPEEISVGIVVSFIAVIIIKIVVVGFPLY